MLDYTNMFEILNFNIKGDCSGSLIALEHGKEFIFNVKRVYYIWGTTYNIVRGKHAHKKLEQLIICISGSCDFILDDGKNKKVVHLNKPTIGLYIKAKIWREFTNFSKDCIIMVLANEHYDEADYIRNYDEFKKTVNMKI